MRFQTVVGVKKYKNQQFKASRQRTADSGQQFKASF